MAKRRRKTIAMVLMLGVTILASSGSSQPSNNKVGSLRRFLAMDHTSGHELLTLVTDETTAMLDPSSLYAGLQVRVYGVQSGRIIRARRIEIIE